MVPNYAMPMVIILGNILKQAELLFKRDEVIVSKISRDIFLTQIEVTPESEVDLNHIINESIKSEVAELIMSYKPVKTKATDITINIVVKEERSIYIRLRRLPILECEIVEKQIEEWLGESIIEACSSEYASPLLVVKKRMGAQEYM